MHNLESILIVAVVFSAVVFFVKILSDNRIRRLLIEKGMVDEKIRFLYNSKLESVAPASLKWGMVLVGIGLAFLIGVFVPTMKEAMVIACVFLFGGTGLIIYYLYAKAQLEKHGDK